MFSFIQYWKALRRFKALPPEDRSIVFYAEDAGSWRYFEPVISELTGEMGKSICYVTSSPQDPVLEMQDPRIKSFCVGSGTSRTLMFQFLQAGVMVMTMPDLDVYHIKRSKYPVRYVYMFHSMVSSHMIYRQRSFDNFDTIFCVGPHHNDEIRAAEDLYKLPAKNLVDTGYGILDTILRSREMDETLQSYSEGPSKRVLIAPSWGDNALLESNAEDLVQVLLEAGHNVTVRPHSMTVRRQPKMLKKLQNRFASNSNFHLDLALSSLGTVENSDIMISDWSGAALEYAFGLERPVIFVDVPRKVNNPEYQKILFEPIEAKLRTEIGAVISPEKISEVPSLVDRLCENPGQYRERIREMRSQWVYNIGSSGKVAAKYIAKAADAINC